MNIPLLLNRLFKNKEICRLANELHAALSGDIDFNVAMRYGSREELKKNIEKLSKKKKIDIYKLYLYAGVRLAHSAYHKYLERKISLKIYYDTMRDIEVWCENFYKQTGYYGLKEFDWICNSTELKVFKLGRLQFELISLPKSYKIGSKTYYKGDIVINVHIRQGEPFNYALCVESYKMALLFFRGVKEVFVCNSWLINPVLRDFLDKDSNIIKFQSDYMVLETDDESKMAEERIFDFVKNPEKYPQNTSLQKKAKQYLSSGKKIGCSFGIYDSTDGTLK